MLNPTIVQEAIRRLSVNLSRVDSLLQSYHELAGTGRGRASVQHVDILRAAVVLLHASLEDLLRSLEVARIDQQVRDGVGLERIRFTLGDDLRKEELSLSELARAHRDKTVRDVIHLALERELATRTYNNMSDVVEALRRLNLDKTKVSALGAPLNAMMRRRHHIAHRADRNDSSGRGHHPALPLSANTVRGWLDNIRQVGNDLKTQLSARSNK